MRATARVYWRLLGAGFRRQSAYRLAALGGLVANLTFGLLKVAILFATVRAAGGELHGYDTASMSTYVWLSQGLLGSVNLNGRTDLALRVKDGQVAVDFRQLSLGQRMRAEVAAALLHSPRLVILDEPTIGLDVLAKQRLREFLIGERRRHGTTLLLTTHDMGDVERLCDRILVIDHGRLAYDGDLPGLSRTVGVERVLVVDLAEPTPDLTGLDGARHLSAEAGGLRQRLAFDAEQTTAAKVLAAVSDKAEVLDLTVEEPDIEDVVRRIYAASR